MKFSVFFGLVIVAVVAQQGESSVTRDGLVEVLKGLNTVTGLLVNEANNYFLTKLENRTQIQEWSVDIQVNVVSAVTQAAYIVLNTIKDSVVAVDPSSDIAKLLTCAYQEEPALLEALKKAAKDNGWCNNRLAGNLTVAFQSVTRHMVDRNVVFRQYLDSFSSCKSGDSICFTEYINSIAKYIESEFGSGDTILTAVEDVVRVYKIMFGQDVPACNNEYLFPEMFGGLHNSIKNTYACLNA